MGRHPAVQDADDPARTDIRHGTQACGRDDSTVQLDEPSGHHGSPAVKERSSSAYAGQAGAQPGGRAGSTKACALVSPAESSPVRNGSSASQTTSVPQTEGSARNWASASLPERSHGAFPPPAKGRAVESPMRHGTSASRSDNASRARRGGSAPSFPPGENSFRRLAGTVLGAPRWMADESGVCE
ncbi:hypothetical protein DIPPA_31447 [Diplonema papillatum]|nr:hypothetical protein DIPPA_31447 [Diplonema papillatum]